MVLAAVLQSVYELSQPTLVEKTLFKLEKRARSAGRLYVLSADVWKHFRTSSMDYLSIPCNNV